MKKKSKCSNKKITWWIIAIILFYFFTAANVSSGIVEEKTKVERTAVLLEPVVVEKMVKTTKYVTERVPYGTPVCAMVNMNYSYTFLQSEDFSGGKRTGICTYLIKNEEDMAGNFTFYAQFFKDGALTDGPEKKKAIGPFSTERFEWNVTLDIGQSLACMIQVTRPAQRMRCYYLEPITYYIKEVPKTVEELKNVTEYKTVNKTVIETVKQNVTKNIYTNKYFGYKQFFYFGY